MFVDYVKMKLVAGKGGDGSTSFRREKYIPMGGPDGASGGKGGDIIFQVEKGLKTLIDLKYHKTLKAHVGGNGKGSNCIGAASDDIIIKVPAGTTVYDDDTGLIIADLIENTDECIIAHGGRGGRGNKAFSTHSDPAPNFSELGEPGEIRFIRCELKVLADVGLVGMPSVGKSTILSKVSGATPKIAAYHFTTLSPNLGLIKLKDERTFVLADLPGLIEGASKGIGLGQQFLRHAMRTKVLAHVIDMSGVEGRNPWDDYQIIREELESYDKLLAVKKEIVIANKSDVEGYQENLQQFKQKYPDVEVIEISALNNVGMDKMIIRLADILDDLETTPIYQENDFERTVIYKFKNEKPYTITKNPNHNSWIIRGKEIEKLFSMTRWNETDAQVRFARKLKGMGIEEELETMGAKRGDEVEILDYIFIFKE